MIDEHILLGHTHLDLEMTCITTVLIPTYTEPTQLLDQTIRNDVGLIFFNSVLCLSENIFFTKLNRFGLSGSITSVPSAACYTGVITNIVLKSQQL